MTARPRSRAFARFPLLVLAVLLLAAPAWAQFDTAQVSGTILDTSGGVLPGVDVVLVAEGTGLERRAVTNESGLYTFPNVPVGDYTANVYLFAGSVMVGTAKEKMTVSKSGFEQFMTGVSRNQSLFYGLGCVALALFTGWLAGVIFRRD